MSHYTTRYNEIDNPETKIMAALSDIREYLHNDELFDVIIADLVMAFKTAQSFKDYRQVVQSINLATTLLGIGGYPVTALTRFTYEASKQVSDDTQAVEIRVLDKRDTILTPIQKDENNTIH